MSAKTIGYYPGCSLEGTAVEYDQSARACCATLGITLEEIPDWSCCGASPAHAVDHLLSGSLSARNLALAAENGIKAVTTPCPSCLVNLKSANNDLKDPAFREKVERLVDRPCSTEVETQSLLQVIYEAVGTKEIEERVKRSLEGLKVASYYGCILNRPPEVMQFDDPENPIAMDAIMQACGAEAVEFPHKTECCGASHGVPRKELVMELSGRILEAAHENGANCVVVACPLCQMNLDLRQGQINAFKNSAYDIPVFYFSQLLGFALGLKESELGFDKLAVSPKRLLKKLTETVA